MESAAKQVSVLRLQGTARRPTSWPIKHRHNTMIRVKFVVIPSTPCRDRLRRYVVRRRQPTRGGAVQPDRVAIHCEDKFQTACNTTLGVRRQIPRAPEERRQQHEIPTGDTRSSFAADALFAARSAPNVTARSNDFYRGRSKSC